jgi:hypothetical protein
MRQNEKPTGTTPARHRWVNTRSAFRLLSIGRYAKVRRVDTSQFERVVAEGRALQERLSDLAPVAVGGTATALHCQHRYSLDVDVVSPLLSSRFADVTADLERWQGWRTNRLNPPVLILGEHGGVELGVRQLRRAIPLQTTQIRGLRIPTAGEMLRVKAFLLTDRRATRDFVDVAALTLHLGAAAIPSAALLNLVYGPRVPQTWISAFAEACESEPVDLSAVPLSTYKGLRAPLTDWTYVADRCRELGRELLKLELQGKLPTELPHDMTPEPRP